MSLTPEQRSEISRQNGKKSRGPVTEEGKARSRQNAMKHGLRAEILPLPTEAPEVIQVRADSWNDFYQPQSPAAQHLVNQCVRATLLADRVDRAHNAVLTRQIRNAEADWDLDQDDRIAAMEKMLATDPAEAVRRLKQTGNGCLSLFTRWERLGEQLAKNGRWTGPERDEAIRLMGLDPSPEALQASPEAWLTRLFNLMCRKNPAEDSVRWLLARVPEEHRATYRLDALPDAADALAGLREMVAGELSRLEEACERLGTERDDPDRDEAPARALVVQDAPTARLFLRYHSEARTSFHKAYSELVRTLERDKDAAAESISSGGTGGSSTSASGAKEHGWSSHPLPATAAVSPNEPAAAAGGLVESPNEPADPQFEAQVAALAAILRGEDVPVLPFATTPS
jgi:hypothetical protein